uniref:Protein LIAT1-like n=1 Tax=Phallusia mammillata TaxID=59560 RepID=A0A6F9DJW0_9ASCI|nr:protein LIAT1-like [Phallusia mammillata]
MRDLQLCGIFNNMEVSSVIGRKTISSSAVDKLKKKRRKKRKIKEGKRSSASSTSATGSPDSAERPHKSRSSFSCPPNFNTIKPKKVDEDMDEVCQNFNDSLRWLPYIVTYSNTLPPKSTNSRLCSPIASKIVGTSTTLSETLEEEEERIAIYKMNRRKRYLAAQQALVSLYPDANIYAGATTNIEDRYSEQESLLTEEQRRNHRSNAIFSSSLLTDPPSENKFELAMKSVTKDAGPPISHPIAS